MKITIGHLFHDLLNLYGENGNVLALEKAFMQQGIDVEIKNFSIDNEPWNLEDIDILYIGSNKKEFNFPHGEGCCLSPHSLFSSCVTEHGLTFLS